MSALADYRAKSGRLVAVVDETADAEDIDGDGNMNLLVAWTNPLLTGIQWEFQHATGSSIPSVGAAWMADEPRLQRVGIAFEEAVQGLSLNSACDDLDQADGDATDEVPTWARFGTGGLLGFPGVGVALSPARGGIVLGNDGGVYFRASEAAQGADLNGDGDALDFVLSRNSIVECEPVTLGTTVDLDLPVLCSDGLVGGAFFARESDVGMDLNGNGFVGENVIRYVAF